MNEKELAEYYEKRRGDTSLWSEKPTKANVRRGGSVVFSIRLKPQELQLLRRRAEEEGRTISELIRWGALQAAQSPSRVYVRTIWREFDDGASASAIDAGLAGMTEGAPVITDVEEPFLDSYSERTRVPAPYPRQSWSELASARR